jgi:hypothetical protein
MSVANRQVKNNLVNCYNLDPKSLASGHQIGTLDEIDERLHHGQR